MDKVTNVFAKDTFGMGRKIGGCCLISSTSGAVQIVLSKALQHETIMRRASTHHQLLELSSFQV